MDTPAPTPGTWEIRPVLSKEQFEVAKQHEITPMQAQLLFNRGLTSIEDMAKFRRAAYEDTLDPLALIDMPRAVERIHQALMQREYITVYGDYDADGVTSSALLFRALRTLKQPEVKLDFHIPHRLRDGCGLNKTALDQFKKQGTQLIITTDCASSDVEQVAYAQQLGIDVIITDHHRPPTQLPAAYAIINPWRPGHEDGKRFLCGVGVAFKLVQALYRKFGRPEEEVQEFLDLVAIGTIADIAPLQGENHTLVHLGLQRLNTTNKPGLLELIKQAGMTLGQIQERNISFSLAPRINAAGRMEHASLAFNLLTTDSTEEAARCVQRLEALNQQRQVETSELMQHIREQARLQDERLVVLVHGDDWHEGIIGLVAGKLAEEIDKPVLVLSNNRQTQLSRGSARSRKGFNIIEALRGFGGHLERYGGHAQAAGFTIASAAINDLHTHLNNWYKNGGDRANALIGDTQQPDETGVVIEDVEPMESKLEQQAPMADLLLSKREPDYRLYKELREIAPFGAGNPEPIFKMEGVRLLNAWASGFEKKNLRLKLGSSASNIVYFATLLKGAELCDTYKHHTHVNIVFRLESRQDDSKQDVWLKVLAIEPTH